MGEAMRRREFAMLVGTAFAAWPLAASAQQSAVPVIGFLSAGSADENEAMMVAFQQGLQESGYIGGQHVKIEYRWAEGRSDRLPAMADDLVRRRVAVIAATNTSAALAAKAATTTIPIVFEIGLDPVRLGLVSSLSKPGGNVTGVTQLNAVVTPKRLELLRELLPKTSVMALLVNPANPANAEAETSQMRSAAQSLGVQLHVLSASVERDLDGVFTSLIQMGAGGLVVGADPLFYHRSELLGALAAHYAVPAVSENRGFVTAGGLLSYGGSVADAYRIVGVYVGRVLKGAKPADLPVQLGTKVELIINLKAAKILGIAFPLTLLGRADEVIE
jgi:putative tryptophan/tyrosine transport system substrate-binding protein